MKDIARFLKTIADDSRLRILWLLFHYRELCVCDLAQALDVNPSKVSRHLAILRNAGLVTDRREGAWSFYSLCSMCGELEAALMRLLQDKLAGHPEAMALLCQFDAGVTRRNGDRPCSAAYYPYKLQNPNDVGRKSERVVT